MEAKRGFNPHLPPDIFMRTGLSAKGYSGGLVYNVDLPDNSKHNFTVALFGFRFPHMYQPRTTVLFRP